MTFKQIQKLFLSLFLVVSFGSYAVWNSRTKVVAPLVSLPNNKPSVTGGASIDTTKSAPTVPVPTTLDAILKYLGTDGEDGAPLPTRKSVRPPTSAIVPNANPSSNAIYKDGSYAGPESYAYTGTIQVTAIIRGGKIVEAQTVDASQSRTSKQINIDALPILKTETIKVQSANVNAVSGATYTTAAYIESLTAALAKAKV